MVTAQHLTGASAIVTLVVDELYPSGVVIEGFNEDDLMQLDNLTRTEYNMGVDGKLSAGFVYYPIELTLGVMPNHSGYKIFENVAQVQQTLVAPLALSMTIALPGIKRKYTLPNGYVTEFAVMPSVNRLIQPATVGLVFERCTWENYEV